MIVYIEWESSKSKPGYSFKNDHYYCQGWFLFGLIPLYIRRYNKDIKK